MQGADEDGAGAVEAVEQGAGVVDQQLEVFGGVVVGGGDHGVAVVDEDDRAVVGEGAGGDVAAREGLQLLGEGAAEGFDQGGVVGDGDRAGEDVVLGLGEQVGGDEGRVGAVVGEDQDLAGAGDAVDVDEPEDLALGGGDVGVAGADDLVDAGDLAGAERGGGDRLGAADGEDPVDAGELGGQQHDGVGARGEEDDLGDAGDLRGDRGHQHGGGVGGGATGGVDGDAAQRAGAADEVAVVVVEAGVAGELGGVEAADVVGGEIEGVAELAGDRLAGGGALVGRELEALQLAALEAEGELGDGGVASLAHGGDDLAGGDIRGALEAGGAGAELAPALVALARSAEVEDVHGANRTGCGEPAEVKPAG